MARYEHLQIYRAAYDLTLHAEKLVRNFSRYNKYTLGTDLRNRMRGVLELVIEANNTVDKTPLLLRIRREVENLKVLCRLCNDCGAFARGRKSYLYMAKCLTDLARQNEGWLKQSMKKEKRDLQAATGEGNKSFSGRAASLLCVRPARDWVFPSAGHDYAGRRTPF